ncbi:hypothetical protein 15570_00025 [Lokiarchaeota virus WyrdV1]|nr:hypothetical protein 15570_00025 [Lokiarchaeota virus WyrdV1]
MRNKKKKYYAVFCIKEHDVFNMLAKKRIRGSNQIVRFRKGTYVVNVSFPTYVKGLNVFYFIDIKKGQQLAKNTEINIAKGHILFKENAKDKPLMSPKFLDMLISQKIVGQLTSNLSNNALKMNIITLIVGAIIGGLIGYIIAGMI